MTKRRCDTCNRWLPGIAYVELDFVGTFCCDCVMDWALRVINYETVWRMWDDYTRHSEWGEIYEVIDSNLDWMDMRDLWWSLLKVTAFWDWKRP
ncbi:hypothetical protein [Candidatus Magnetobacterium casense]|uniref:Uncharacterized protein n=1 Tax=Candidatus Magnetobacterium casense TaxID=1455061 RepID=A0ABS6RZH1_9BACT|nr:hypothetical protein [Candidatus Magnetobacterium casensis]MBV6341755.1 hypothetical protein [Candidatus Magnetobacterium casensis]